MLTTVVRETSGGVGGLDVLTIDLAVEAAHQRGGIVHFVSEISHRKRCSPHPFAALQ